MTFDGERYRIVGLERRRTALSSGDSALSGGDPALVSVGDIGVVRPVHIRVRGRLP